MTKECIICGDEFEAVRETRQYCDKCQKNSKKAQQNIDKAIINSKRHMGEFDIPKARTCSYCGKEFLSVRKRDFCCKECERNYRIENNTCQWCKKPLFPEVKAMGPTTHPGCKEAAYEAWARRKGWYRNCKHCGKEYLAKSHSQTFCSQQCSIDYKAAERVKPTEYHCCICKKDFIIPRNNYYDTYPKRALCSDECRAEYQRRYNLWKKKQQEESKALAEKIKQQETEQKEKKFKEEVEKYGLCNFCNTLYKDCDWISSSFRIKPKGAIYKNSKIIECPKFTKEKVKK